MVSREEAFLVRLGQFVDDLFAQVAEAPKPSTEDSIALLQETMTRHGIRFAVVEGEIRS